MVSILNYQYYNQNTFQYFINYLNFDILNHLNSLIYFNHYQGEYKENIFIYLFYFNLIHISDIHHPHKILLKLLLINTDYKNFMFIKIYLAVLLFDI